MYTYSKPVLGLSEIQSASFLKLFHGYETALAGSGYNPHVTRFHMHAIAHFGVWLERKGVELEEIDEATLKTFERHRPRCRCPGTSRSRRQEVVRYVRVFLQYLRKQGMVPAASRPEEPSQLIVDFLQ